jgi:hypothetical protein
MIIDAEPYRGYPVTELKSIVAASEANDAPALASALKAALQRRGLGLAFPELAEDLRTVERASKGEAA